MDLPPSLVKPDTDLQWRELGPGTRWATVHKFPQGGTLYRIHGDPGATFPGHTHRGGEEVYVMAGDYSDGYGRFEAGTFLSYPAGSHHAPSTERGCELLVIWW
ncbi:MAG TPA: cupin domain-containing protein [bacterium]|nr:cupin domain-containing protein [bacterium]